jgi:hypothetical protein
MEIENQEPRTENPAPLSPNAARLLAYLEAYAHERGLARTYRYLAGVLSIPIRELYDLSHELISAGHVVLAECNPPHGTWLNPCRDAEEVRAAWRYAESLRDRGVAILIRRRDVERAIRATEARRKIETTGQRRLF